MTRLAALALVAASCGGAPRVDLTEVWPDQPGDYGDVRARWTRHGRIRKGFDLVLDVHATFKSSEWRAAYAAERARRQDLPSDAAAALATEEQAAAGQVYEVQALIATGRSEWNDLGKGARSMWRVTLVGDGGREVLPTSMQPDRRARDEVASWFPGLGPFHKPYVITFPKVAPDGKPLLEEGSTRLGLRFGSSLGSVEIVWQE